jgi:glucosylceramidase
MKQNPIQFEDGSTGPSMIRSAWPQGILDDTRVKQAWALFFSKFITAYKAAGLSMWGLTIQVRTCEPYT